MAKIKKVVLKADFYVTGVWINKGRNITHLMMHEVESEGQWLLGEITPVKEIVRLITEGKVIKSLRWSYISGQWNEGVLLKTVIKSDGSYTVAAVSENIVTNNLDNLILMNTIV